MSTSRCRICAGSPLPVHSFGPQPIANAFLTAEASRADTYRFDLAISVCPECGTVQLVDQPDRERMFHGEYAFFTGTSRAMTEHFARFASWLRDAHLRGDDPFVVEIGSNDGTLLSNFRQWNIRHLGIEPSANVAQAARDRGVPTEVRFFDADTARAIVAEHGKASAFIAANVMCHIPYLHSVVEGIDLLLRDDGVVAFEDPYAGDVLDKGSYDQWYDEHVFLFSLHSVARVFAARGFELIDVQPQVTHGGSMRYVLARKGQRTPSAAVGEYMAREDAQRIADPEAWRAFGARCDASKLALVSLLKQLKADGKRVAGYAATSKSTTILNYCGIGPELIEFISDTTPIKQGKVTPGTRIPVLPRAAFGPPYPDYAVLFGWNHEKEIVAKETDFVANGGKWIRFFPQVEIV
jgi:methylation protein EvaC